MSWIIEYYERQDASQPAEVFEDMLDQRHPKLSGKLIRITDALEQYGPSLGGGLIEPCHGYAGLWEMRAIFGQTLGRELFGFDGQYVILLHGYVKRAGQPASAKDLTLGADYWRDYVVTRKVSPQQKPPTGSGGTI